MDPKKAKIILRETKKILNGLRLNWWISAGTALGLYRDQLSNEFLKKDTDLDIGILGLSKEEIDTLVHSFIGNGFSLVKALQADGKEFQIVFVKDDILVDIYLFELESSWKTGIIGIVNHNEHGIMRKPFLFPLTKIKGYPMLNPPELYLEIRFGPNWRIPSSKKIPWQFEAANLEFYRSEDYEEVDCKSE